MDTPTNINHQGIGFVIAAGLTQGQVRAITEMVNGLNVAEFAGHVTSLEFAQNVANGLAINPGTGENAMATIRINSDANADAVTGALTTAGTQSQAVRDAAREQAEREEAERIENERRQQVITQLSAEFAGYISNIAFANVDVPGYELDEDSDPVTASVTLPNNFTAEQGHAFIEGTVMESINDAREAAEEAARQEAERIENERRQQVIAQLSADFAGYISNITFADVDVPGYELDEDSDPVTASVILPNNFTAEQGHEFIEDTVMESINDARDPGLDPNAINDGLIPDFVLTRDADYDAPAIAVQVYTHGLTNAQRAAIVAGEDPSQVTSEATSSLQERFSLINALARNRIADNNITKFVIIANEEFEHPDDLNVQFVDFTNRSDDSDGFALIIPFEEDPAPLQGRINMGRQIIEGGGVPTAGVRTIRRRDGVSHEKPVVGWNV